MPVRDQSAYPGGSLRSPEWLHIRATILDRAQHRCEWCNIPDRTHRLGSLIVLTIAHLDHNPANSDPTNLRALCQACHFGYDSRRRVAARRVHPSQGTLSGVPTYPWHFNKREATVGASRAEGTVTPPAVAAAHGVPRGSAGDNP